MKYYIDTMLKYSLKQIIGNQHRIPYFGNKKLLIVVFFTFFNYIFVYILIKKNINYGICKRI